MNIPSQDFVIEVRKLGKQVTGPEGELIILREVNLEVRAGEALAIVGTSGAGKSTLLGLLAGLDAVTGGSVSLFGHDLSRLDEDGRAALRANRVGFVFQSFQLLPGLTALENVMLPLELNGRAGIRQTALTAVRPGGRPAKGSPQAGKRVGRDSAPWASAHRMESDAPEGRAGVWTGGNPSPRMATTQSRHGFQSTLRQCALDSLARVGLADRTRHYPHQLSGGEQQRVAIARAFAPRPRVLFADEPTGNLDPATGLRVIELMFSLRDEQGVALVMVTHDQELTNWCDRRYDLVDGRLEAVRDA